MPSFTQTESDFVNRAYERAQVRIENLEESNLKNQSDIRQTTIDTLRAHQEQIENLGFFEKTDFTLEEIKSTVDAAGELDAAELSLEDTHELTLMELSTDLAELLQKIMLDQYLGVLKLFWLSAKRYARSLPDQIPEEVVDDYNVGVFNKTQARLNQIAFNVRDVSQRRCLNSDDYPPPPGSFTAAVVNARLISSQEATDNYIALQKLKEAERAAREANEVSIAGQIWDLIGWDSPTDFLWDAGLAIATGGASKVVKWGQRITRLTKITSKAATKLEKLLVIEKRAHRMEQRIIEISRAATRLKKANKFVQLPRKIELTFEALKRTRKQLELAELIGKQVTKDYIRSVASSVIVKSTGMAGSVQVGKAASKELARASILSYLDGTQLGTEIKELRGKINYTLMIAAGFNSKNQDRLMAYFGLLLARELIARLAISVAHKRDLTVEQFANEFIDSAGSALETMLLDVPIISEAQLKFLGRTIMSTIRKILAEIAKKLAPDLLAP